MSKERCNKYRHHKSAESHPSLANAELMSDSPVLEGFAFAEGCRRLVESDTVRTTDTLQQESGKNQLVDVFLFDPTMRRSFDLLSAADLILVVLMASRFPVHSLSMDSCRASPSCDIGHYFYQGPFTVINCLFQEAVDKLKVPPSFR